MISQTDEDFLEEIQDFGCLFLCLAYFKTMYAGKEWTYKELNSLWANARVSNYIDSNCIIIDYTGVIRLMDLPLIYMDKHSPLAELSEGYYGITKWLNPNNNYNHFVVGNNKPVEYDPYSKDGSKTVREGYPVDMRLFKIV